MEASPFKRSNHMPRPSCIMKKNGSTDVRLL